MTKTPETTIDTLDMGDLCLLTLTNRHLRGQVTRVFPGGVKQKEQIDVLLNGLAGYSVVEVPMGKFRMMIAAVGVVIALGGWGLYAALGKLLDFSVATPIVATVIGAAVVFLSRKIKDQAAFELNVMGGKFSVPLKSHQVEKVRAFITKIQNAKIAYDEENG